MPLAVSGQMLDRRLAVLLLTGCNTVYGLDDLAYDAGQPESDPLEVVDELVVEAADVVTGQAPAPLPPEDLPPELVDRELVVRYFIDEAQSGSSPETLDDAADPLVGHPVALQLQYDDVDSDERLAFTLTNENRGLSWAHAAHDARASVLVEGTKLHETLDGTTAATLEAVINIDAVTTYHSRIVHFGDGEKSGYLTVSSDGDDSLNVYWQDVKLGNWSVPFIGGRHVIHVVIDTSLEAPDQRMKLYLDGDDSVEPTDSMAPDRDDRLELPEDSYFVLGNREIGDRSFEGVLHYAAVYAAALTVDEVGDNARELMVRDDR